MTPGDVKEHLNPSAEVEALPQGYSLQEYRIESLLGAGGFGLTYLAMDSNLRLRVALKEYLPSGCAARAGDSTVQPKPGAAGESFRWGLTRFLDEARTLASFRHPNIVRVMRFFEANRTGYMVMELLEGTPLSEWLPKHRPLSQQAVLQLVIPLLDGLEVIHRSGYLHRDIKPANIFVRNDGTPVLLDFGSARQLLDDTTQGMTVVVSPGYAPMEQYTSQGKQGAWTDLYALGGVIYWMVTGIRPVEAVGRFNEDPLTPAVKAAEGSGYGGEFLALIDWALKMRHDQRPQSVAEFRKRMMSFATMGVQEAVTAAGADLAAASRATTTPVPEQSVMPQTGTPLSSTPIAGAPGVALDPEQLHRIEAELARHIGPIAAVLTRNAAKKAPSIAAVAEAVAAEITDSKARTLFLRKFAGSGGTRLSSTESSAGATTTGKFPPEVLQRAEGALARHIGAVAKVCVKRAAAKARDESDLYVLIAEEIADPMERKTFLRNAQSASGRRLVPDS